MTQIVAENIAPAQVEATPPLLTEEQKPWIVDPYDDGVMLDADGMGATYKTIREIEKLLDENFPTYSLISNNDKENVPLLATRVPIPENVALHQAFERYAMLALKPNVLCEYIQKHLKDGFTRDELGVFITALSLRVNPAVGLLEGQDATLRNAQIFSPELILKNLLDETGASNAKLPSHITLLQNSLRVLNAILPDKKNAKPLPDNICTYAMIDQLLRFHKQGIVFDQAPVPAESSEKHARYEQFNKACHEHGLIMPHMMLQAWIEHAGLKPYQSDPYILRDQLQGHSRADKADGIRARPREIHRLARTVQMEGTESIRHSSVDVSADDFETALYWVTKFIENAKEGNASLIDYAIGTLENQHIAFNPYDASNLLNVQLELLTREQNAAGHSHLKAQGDAVDSLLGYIDPDHKLNDKEYQEKREMLTQWSSSHVNPQIGVEAEHARHARDLVIMLIKSCMGSRDEINPRAATLLTNMFNKQCETGYLPRQHKHMQAAKDTLQAIRDKAMLQKESGGEDLFIRPMQEDPSRAPKPKDNRWRELMACVPGNMLRN